MRTAKHSAPLRKECAQLRSSCGSSGFNGLHFRHRARACLAAASALLVFSATAGVMPLFATRHALLAAVNHLAARRMPRGLGHCGGRNRQCRCAQKGDRERFDSSHVGNLLIQKDYGERSKRCRDVVALKLPALDAGKFKPPALCCPELFALLPRNRTPA